MPVSIETFVLGPLMTNCYVLRSAQECWIVDPGIWPDKLLEFLQAHRLTPSRVLLTHGHGDHIAGITQLREAYPHILVACPQADAAMLPDAHLNLSAEFGFPITVGAADEVFNPPHQLTCGQSHWQVLDTSGHTAGGVSYYCPGVSAVLTGDALFAGSIGRCDIPGGDMSRLVRNIRENLFCLPDATAVLSGHGEPSTIGIERRYNPYITG